MGCFHGLNNIKKEEGKMENLARVSNCDEFIRRELEKAGITTVVVKKNAGEVAYSIIGELGGFKFSRAWSYWVVTGDMPMEKAMEIYTIDTGGETVRPWGGGSNISPKKCAIPTMDTLITLGIYEVNDKGVIINGPSIEELQDMCETGKINAPRYISEYHIDDQNGLNLFAQVIRRYNL